MSITPIQKYNLPVTGAALDTLKMIAAFLMVVDHYNTVVLGGAVVEMFFAGRVVFPLFCYAAACAVLRAGLHRANDLAIRLLILALLVAPVTQAVFSLGTPQLNVLFTLAASMALIPWMDKASSYVRATAFVAAILLSYLPNQWEFGFPGILLPSAIYLFMTRGGWNFIWVFLMAFAINFSGAGDILSNISPTLWTKFLPAPFFSILVPVGLIYICASIPGQQRLLGKYFLHVKYCMSY